MSQGTDVTGVLSWGVRRYAWLIALFVITLGIVVPGLLERTADRYEASAQVGPIRVLSVPNVDILPRMATDVFRIVPDSPEVKQAAGVPESQTLGADRLELVAAQDNIIGRLLTGSEPIRQAPFVVRLFNAFPLLRRIPGRIVGLGVRRERVRSPLAPAKP